MIESGWLDKFGPNPETSDHNDKSKQRQEELEAEDPRHKVQ